MEVPRRTFTTKEVAQNNTIHSIWCIIDGKSYYDELLVPTQPTRSTASIAMNFFRNIMISASARLGATNLSLVHSAPGGLSQVPYAEPIWLNRLYRSPYYNKSHLTFLHAVRNFVDVHMYPEAQQKESDGTYISKELIGKMAQNNILAMRLGPGVHLHNLTLMNFLPGDQFDYFHDLILSPELSRAVARGFQDADVAGLAIGLTAIRQWAADPRLRDKISQECLSGQKFICLAITEPFAGSDVSGIQTTATKSRDGQYYIVSGVKKWITNGMFADYFVTGCKSEDGFSVLLIPRDEKRPD
ncbi:hypothetical protein Z517_07615 [Fonsecaea pedrosoi CBS 271.37]|uniref:Acyl-CoA oxidase/dehydrogenase middle domain-containing protein n=1 Tax=Fonsecaea pedrosoi CBS 271.37 TaxID=1442368 RepID=A0A0D2EU63_9EURO|nr:uncharacterized protein Z517_07615 [Fonsecaea pedrosoi CBS 271.37]KIW77782.1 hypothetical protein Z517_07615 [Fonsecaea pedrosoi CBS 271.37]